MNESRPPELPGPDLMQSPIEDPDHLAGPHTAAAKQVLGERIAGAAETRRRQLGWWHSLPLRARVSAMALFLAALYLLPLWRSMPIIPTTGTDWMSLLGGNIVTFVLVALGLNVVVGMAGLLDLGYVGFYAVGAYVVGILGSQHANVPWLLCLPLAIAISMLSGLILGAPTLRLRGDYLAIVTLGFGEIIRLLAQHFEWMGASSGISKIPGPPSILGLHFDGTGYERNRSYYWLGLTLCILAVFLLGRLERSRVGRAWTAIREDEDAAELMGVPTFKFKLWAFAIGAAVGGMAGVLYASKVRFINPETFTLQISILFVAAVVLGGPGNMPGVIAGALAVSYLPERFRFLNEKRYFFFGLALVVMMIFRPQGLLPRRRPGRRDESATARSPDPPPGEPMTAATPTNDVTTTEIAHG